MKGQYKSRIVDGLLQRKLKGKGAVLIEGAKWCGKTSTAEQAAGSVLYLADPKKVEQNILMASESPDILLDGPTPRLLDEWQLAWVSSSSLVRQYPPSAMKSIILVQGVSQGS